MKQAQGGDTYNFYGIQDVGKIENEIQKRRQAAGTEDVADPVGRFNIAFDDPTLTWEPTWTRLDNTDNLVTRYTIDRGRQYELDTTDTGRATVEITDTDGVLDPTNPSGPYYGQIEPLLQAVVQRWNPISSAWRTRFRGFIEDYDYDFDPSQRVNKLTISLVDLFETSPLSG